MKPQTKRLKAAVKNVGIANRRGRVHHKRDKLGCCYDSFVVLTVTGKQLDALRDEDVEIGRPYQMADLRKLIVIR